MSPGDASANSNTIRDGTGVIICGSIAIAIVQWPEAVKNSGFGSGGYNQGLTGTIFLEALMAGIPIILFAVVAYLLLSFLLFRPGELEEYKAKKILKKMSRSPSPKRETRKGSEPQNHDYAD